MRRREFITLLGGGAAAASPLAAWAQQAGRTYRLGCLFPPPRDSPPNMAFFDELRRLSFVEGQNLTVEYRAYGQHIDLISQYAAELVNARVDVIVVAGEEAIHALQQATKTIPIVALGGDLLGSGFVKSLSRPDGNTTGVSFFAFETDGKRQDILIEAVPGLRLMAILIDINVQAVPTSPLRGLMNCKRRRAYTISSFQFIVSPEPRRSRQPWMVRRHLVPQR
jgi:putative tryptophan/tyrosine transport system substrate-binding protein